MKSIESVTLQRDDIRLEPLSKQHVEPLSQAASDGKLWDLWFTSVPHPTQAARYVSDAMNGQAGGSMLPWAVREIRSDSIIGTTRYHDIVVDADRVEIGYTWYAKKWHRTHVNTTCKLMLLSHAFDVLDCQVVGLRTDNFNFVSQRAIEQLGAKRDGVIRNHAPRRDGTVRDTVMYSILRHEWPTVRKHLESRLIR
jgi:RimJ/RimL family protein N-acetyltransferase